MNSFYQDSDLQRLSGSPPDPGDFRTPFQLDRDRVLHTPAFRALQSKTQVFWSGEYDFYRTRLTHSLEVAQIGRSLCHWLLHGKGNEDNGLTPAHHLDPDLVEAACLSHDLGHPPFGHAGERVLNHLMAPYGGFEGNAQTLRLLAERVFSQSRKGMDPTRAFLDAVLKYKTLRQDLADSAPETSPPENHFLYDEQAPLLHWTHGDIPFPAHLPPGKERDAAKSIECQIMDWADDIAYSLNDLADSVRAGFLTEERIRRWAEETDRPHGEDTPLGELIRAIAKGRIDPFVGKRIGAYLKAARLEPAVGLLSAESHRYRHRLAIDPQARAECDLFKALSYQVVFLSPRLKQLEHKSAHILGRLWEALHRRYVEQKPFRGQLFQLLPGPEAREIAATDVPGEKARLLCDFLASLTDGSAVRLYQRLFEAGHGSIGDLITG